MRILPILLLLNLVGFCENALANISLPAIFTDNMVLQRETEVKIWGWAKSLEKVTLQASWSGETFETVADNYARWEIILPTPKAGGPYQITLKGYNQITLSNILVGEVWLCSGQSNMEWPAASGIDGKEEAIKNAKHPNIRFFTVQHRTATVPQIDLASEGWEICSPETMTYFSAAAYFFGKKLQEELDVPIGLIHSSWGGTPAEAWTSAQVIESDLLLARAADLLPSEPWGPGHPGSIYNAMIAPLTQFKIAGTIWYQGERNTNNAATYKETFSALINSWRAEWGYYFPFYFAQIAPFRGYGGEAGVIVRDAQRRTLELLETGMVVTSDIGDTIDIHPRNKLDVGLRFANLALKNHYKVSEKEASGPLFRTCQLEKDRVRVFFDHAEGLHIEGATCTDFELAGPDGVFHPAGAKIEGGTVLVSAGNVFQPTALRFAWSNTATPNLFNGAGLPTSCFSVKLEGN